jgi:protoporphyrinogen oxidase
MTQEPRSATDLRNVLIVGGGISGLAAAYDLHKAGVKCTLIEENERLS